MRFNSILFLLFSASVAISSPEQCLSFYAESKSPSYAEAVAARQRLLDSASTPSIQSTVAARYFIQQTKGYFKVSLFDPEILARQVLEVTHQSEAISKSAEFDESALVRIEAIKKKVKKLKDQKVPKLTALRGQSDAYLNQIAAEIKQEFIKIQEEASTKTSRVETIDKALEEALQLGLELETIYPIVDKYYIFLNETIKLLETKIKNYSNAQQIQSSTFILNQLMTESNSTSSTLMWIHSAVQTLKVEARTLASLKSSSKDLPKLEMGTFLLESGITLPYLENEIKNRIAKIEAHQKQVQSAKAQRTSKMALIKQRIVTGTRVAVATGSIVAALGGGGYWIFSPSSGETNFNTRHPDIAQVMRSYDEMSTEQNSQALIRFYPKIENRISYEDFVYYTSEANPGNRRHLHEEYDDMIFSYTQKNLPHLSFEQIKDLADATKSYEAEAKILALYAESIQLKGVSPKK
jgi:hypothetical protein